MYSREASQGHFYFNTPNMRFVTYHVDSATYCTIVDTAATVAEYDHFRETT